jgi:hypothetical protein
MKKFKSWIYGIGLLLLSACSNDFLDKNTNPNLPASATNNLILPSGLTGAAFNTTRDSWESTSNFIQHFYDLSNSTYNFQGGNFDNDWEGIYASLKDLDLIISNAKYPQDFGYVGVSKVMSAYLYLYLADVWGEVPFTESLKGDQGILFPKYDGGRVVYDGAIKMLDEGIAALDSATAKKVAVVNDLVYSGNYANWKKAANTLKLKAYLNLRKVDPAAAKQGIEAVLAGDTFIKSNAEDFQFRWGSGANPMNRHPMFQQEYVQGTKAFYMNNYFMYFMITKGDPRLPYYIYRQSTDAPLADINLVPCNARSDCKYGWLGQKLGAIGDGYIGRDQGDPSGIPGDNAVRATFAVYPIGGSYDNNARAERVTASGNGTGYTLWATNFMVHFIKAEAILTMGVEGDARASFEAGIRASMSKVSSLSVLMDANSPAITAAAIDTYVNARLAEYDAASNEVNRLNVLITEKYYASFGMAIESYNDYRRTGMPLNLPDALAPVAPYPVRLPLGNEANINPNAVPKLQSVPVFWDVD